MTDTLEPTNRTDRPRAGAMLSGDADVSERARPVAARLDVDAARAGLTTWAGSHVPGGTVTDVHLADGNGMSSETVLFTVADPGGDPRDLVARVAPRSDAMPVFPRYDLPAQAAVISHVAAHTDLPVPTVVDVHDDPDLLGMPFFVMDRLDGAPLPDMPPYTFEGWLLSADGATRAGFRDACVDVIAAVHGTPVSEDVARAVGFDGPVSAADSLTALLRRDREYYEWAREGGPRSPLIERGLDWLGSHRPDEPGGAVLSWGDSRPSNILWSPDHRVTGVVDWEMATLAPRAADLGWAVFFHDFFQFLAEAFEMPGVPGLFAVEDVEARYRERTGQDVVTVGYHRVAAAVRHAVIMYRIALRGAAHGSQEMPDDPDQLILHRPLLESMLEQG